MKRLGRPRSLAAGASALALGCAGERLSFGDGGFAPDARPDVVLEHPQGGAACVEGTAGEVLGACPHARCLSPTEGFPGGYCAADCSREPCRSDEQCAPLSAQTRVCLRACQSDADCRAREGYVCRAPTERSRPVCIPNSAPVGRREDGSSCFVTANGDAGAGVPLAPLPAGLFAPPNRSLSRDVGLETAAEAEPSLAVHPNGAAFAVSFVGYDARGYWRAGLARTGPDGAPSGPPTRLRDRDYPDLLTPSIAFDPQGTLHLAYVANNTDRPGNAVRYARSTDGGASFTESRSALPEARCNAGCAETAIAIGARNASASTVYLATLARSGDGGASLLVVHAPSGDGVFSPPVTVAEAETVVGARRVPSYASLAVSRETGTVFAAWIAANRYDPLALLGDASSRVRLRASHDGGATWGPVREATRPGDAPVEQVPWVAAARGVVHVAYVSGGLTGRWSVVLATSADEGSTFAHRTVHDDPEPCATHAFAGLAAGADGDAHVAWLENRFGPGAAAYARCPADPRARCSRSERASDVDFEFSTTADASRWHGTRSAVALTPTGVPVLSWSDTRTGGPGVYLSIARSP